MTHESKPDPTDEEIKEAAKAIFEKLMSENSGPIYLDHNDLWDLYTQSFESDKETK